MANIAHFFTDDKYITFLEWQSIYSFWLNNRDYKFYLYSSIESSTPHPASGEEKSPNYFVNVAGFADNQFIVNFNKIIFKTTKLTNKATPAAKIAYFKEYILQKPGDYLLDGSKIYLHKLLEHEGYAIDKNLPIYSYNHIDISTPTGTLISISHNSFVADAVNHYSKEGTILDIGCGDKAMTNQLFNRKITTVDAFEPFKPDIVLDLNTTPLPFKDNSYDTVLALDLIEHLDKDKGEALLVDLKRIASKRILLLTPLWWDDNSHNIINPTSSYFGNEYDRHKSLWTLDDFKDWNRLSELTNLKHYFFGMWEKK